LDMWFTSVRRLVEPELKGEGEIDRFYDMTDNGNVDVKALESFMAKYIEECKERGLTPEQTRGIVTKTHEIAKAILLQELRTALGVVKPLD
jgi:hypothetical protein